MGAEVLEEEEFEPMFASCESKLAGKRIALFGSYGWGDGEWMRDWETRCKEAGAVLICESVICNEMPDDEGIQSLSLIHILDATSAELKATYQEIKDYVLKEFGLKVSSLYKIGRAHV